MRHVPAPKQPRHDNGGDAARGQAPAQDMIDRLEVILSAVSPGDHPSLIVCMKTGPRMETAFRPAGGKLRQKGNSGPKGAGAMAGLS